MKFRKKTRVVVFAIAAVFVAVVATMQFNNILRAETDEVTRLMEQYFNNRLNYDAESAQEKTYYSDEMMDLIYDLDTKDIKTSMMVDYEIKNVSKCNELVYEFDMQVYNTKIDDFEMYPYVIKIDGDWKVVLNSQFLPQEMKQGVVHKPMKDELLYEDMVK